MGAPSTQAKARFWERAITQQARSGLSHREFCELHQLSIHQFRDWKYHRSESRPRGAVPTRCADRLCGARPGADTSAFVPVRLVPSTSASSAPLELVLASGRIVRVPPDFDASALRRLVAALEDAAC